MNTTSKRIVGTLIILAGSSAGVARAVTPIGLIQTCLATAALGDDSQSNVEQADELLRQARKAMAEHNRGLADSFISRTERLNPKYGLFHTGDTPKKCRADFNRSLGLNPDGTSTSAIPPVSLGNSRDPFLGHGTAAQQPASAEMGPGGASGSPGFSSFAQGGCAVVPIRLRRPEYRAIGAAPGGSYGASSLSDRGLSVDRHAADHPAASFAVACSADCRGAVSNTAKLAAVFSVGGRSGAISLTARLRRTRISPRGRMPPPAFGATHC